MGGVARGLEHPGADFEVVGAQHQDGVVEFARHGKRPPRRAGCEDAAADLLALRSDAYTVTIDYDALDRLTTNEARNESKARTIAGVSYWVPLQSGLSTVFLLDYEQVSYERVVPVRPTEKRIALHVLVNF